MVEDRIKRYNLGSQTNYVVYTPENVDENTEVVFYSYAVGTNKDSDGVWKNMEESILSLSKDKIVIFPENSPVMVGNEFYNREYEREAIDIFNIVKEDYGLSTDRFNNAGFSAGFGCSLRTTADYIRSVPNAERQTLILVDGVMNWPIYDSEIDALKQNNTMLISYSQHYRHSYEIEKLSRTGLPILFVVDDSIPQNSQSRWMSYHNVVTQNFFSEGLYNSLIDFSSGKGELPSGYRYQIYNPSTNRIEDIDAKDVASFFGIDTFESMLKQLESLKTIDLVNLSVTSDNRILGSHINNIISNIKNSSFVQNGVSYSSTFSSTTKVPSLIPDIVKHFYTTNATLLLKIANETKEITKIGESIEKIDRESAEEATNLENFTAPVVVPLNDKDSSTQSDTNEEVSVVVSQKELAVKNEVKPDYSNKVEDIKEDVKVEETKGTKEDKIVDNKKEEQPVIEMPKKEENNDLGNDVGNVISDDKKNNTNNTIIDNNISKEDTINVLDEFYDFNELYSDDKKIVYDYNNEYRIVVHKNGDDIIGIEHYYKFDNNGEADKALEMLSEKYANDTNVLNIVQKDNYVKVLFKDELFNDLSVNDIRNRYRNLSEIKRL